MDDDDPWAEYARLQQNADSHVLNDKAWAIDEALEAIIDKIEACQPVTRTQIDNLLINRAAKHRRRRTRLANNAFVFDFGIAANQEACLEARRELRECRSGCTVREWSTLVSIGLGHSYHTVANDHGVPEGTVKTWVRRTRLRLAT